MSKLSFIYLLQFCLLTFITPAYSQSPTQQSLLWEVSGKGLKQPSYIFGTIHAICPTDMIVSDAVKESLKRTAQLSLEVDMDAPDFMAQMQKGALLANDTSLKTLLNTTEYQVLADHFSSTMGIDIAQLINVKPFILSSMLLLQLAECKPSSYEQTLMALAQQQGKEIIGVETVADQINALDKIPQQKQAQLLLESVEKMDEAKAKYKKMVKLYLAQDLPNLEKLLKEDYTSDYKLYEDALFTQRNQKWVPVISKTALEKPTFFAVGAGHLPGPTGILELLRQQGFTVKAVR